MTASGYGKTRYLLLITAILLFLLLLATASMSIRERIERKFVFFPTAAIERTPADAGLKFEDLYFMTVDGIKLNGWFIPAPALSAESANPKITLLWFHGNGGNLGHRVEDLALLNQRLGVNIFIFDYRGYGRSEGRPAESGIYRDARAALDYLASRDDVDRERIVFFGRSLGTAVAVELAGELSAKEDGRPSPQGLILVSPFTSLGDMARILYPYLPLRPLIGNRFNTLARIRDIHRPLLIIHGERDELIPLTQGRQLFNAANPPKSFHPLPYAGHNDSLRWGGEELWERLNSYLASLTQRQNQ